MPHHRKHAGICNQIREKMTKDIVDLYNNPLAPEAKDCDANTQLFQHLFTFRNALHKVTETFNKHMIALLELEEACYDTPLQLNSRITGPLPDIEGKDFSSLSQLRITNSLKRKREEELEGKRK